jgi:cytochrome c oxidase subunit IV
MKQHVVSLGANLLIFFVLLALLAATIGVAFMDMGPKHTLKTFIALLIAVTKASLIMLYFMHVKFSNRLTWAFAGAAFLWLGILIALSMTDFLTRNWLAIDGK